MNGRPVASRSRTPLPGRRSRQVRRASAGLSPVRAGAALVMLATAAAIYGVGASSAFDYRSVQVTGAQLTDPAVIESTLALARGQNLFALATGPLVAALEGLPTVSSAQVEVRLPGTLAVTVDERVPVMVWQVGDRRYLADADGTLFGLMPAHPPADVAKLPVIDDLRLSAADLDVGKRLDPVDLDAATRLASLVPGDVGSSAVSLSVSVSDENGFVLGTKPGTWSAVFGFYTPSLRTTDMIPGQVRLLRSLLTGREPAVQRVILASETDGTYVPRAAPSPSSGKSSPKPSKSP
jgi:cell division septal protein FtsQ